MQSDWSNEEADSYVKRYGALGYSEDMALRTYSARLMGRVPELVMHGGGNTSLKATAREVHGEEIQVLHIKGSGWDLASIEPQGHPAVRLATLQRLRPLPRLSDEEMVNIQRSALLDSAAPNPSVEALLHAYLPHRFIDHTHSIAVCAVTDQPDAEAVCERVWGSRVACVPYIMPGFDLAKSAAEIFEKNPGVEGLVLLKHGLVTFGDTARQSYERMIELVSAAEAYIARRAPSLKPIKVRSEGEAVSPRAAELLPRLRGALQRAGEAAGAAGSWILDLRHTDDTRHLIGMPELDLLARRGVSTPDHVIRTKGWPAVLPEPGPCLSDWAQQVETALDRFQEQYRSYFDQHNARTGGAKTQLDPLPRLFLIRGVGLVGAGRSASEAAIVADIGEAWAATVIRAEAIGSFEPVDEGDLFDMEYWSLEQAKLGKSALKPLAGQVVAVTGAGGAIGAATARAFLDQGAEVVLLDRSREAVVAACESLGGRGEPSVCDVTNALETKEAFDAICRRYGGIDTVVSNAGAAWTGAMADISDDVLRTSFEINFFAHQYVAQAAVHVLRLQQTGGALLFNVSKQAVNPGGNFGAYGIPKAALLALVRQYALELGRDGIRVNAVNPDRIRSGLLTGDMISSRAQSRGLSEGDYMAGNLLGQEVSAADVAQAFVFQALMKRTTGAIATVDGGNVAAMLR